MGKSWAINSTHTMKPPSLPPSRRVQFGKIAAATGHRIVLYGPGGIGKTTLGAMMPGNTAFIDIEESLPRLKSRFAELELTPIPVHGITTFQSIRDALNMPGWEGINNIVIDSGTRVEKLCMAHVIANVKHEKGHFVKSIEGYGFGKGLTHVYEAFLSLLDDLDKHFRAGRNVLIICHDCTSDVPNPEGENWLRYEPRLQSPNSGKSSIRFAIKEWSDHTLFFGYDVAVSEDGKGKGSGTRTIYPNEMPHCMAKSRTTQGQIAVVEGENIWTQILK